MVENSGESTSLFDDYEFLIILVALFAVLVGGGLLWEYFYYKPKMERLNKVNGESTLVTINFGFLFVDEREADHVQTSFRQKLMTKSFLFVAFPARRTRGVA